MNHNYLIVTQWEGSKIKKQFCFGKFRRINASGNKARKLALEYQLYLNNNFDIDLDINKIYLIKENSTYYTVCAVPYSQAREYNKFYSFENCKIFSK